MSREVKVVLLGATGVGKSSLVLRYVTSQFNPHSESTIGAAFMSKMTVMKLRAKEEGGVRREEVSKIIKFQIWDTAGQEKYESLAPMYYRTADGAVIVYDVTNNSSFLKVKEWVAEVKEKCDRPCAIVVVGNKVDLLDGKGGGRCVAQDVAWDYVASVGGVYVEASAKDGDAIEEIFQIVVSSLPGIYDEDDDDSEMGSMRGFKLNHSNRGGGGACCR